jgi:hypothetical protein
MHLQAKDKEFIASKDYQVEHICSGGSKLSAASLVPQSSRGNKMLLPILTLLPSFNWPDATVPC